MRKLKVYFHFHLVIIIFTLLWSNSMNVHAQTDYAVMPAAEVLYTLSPAPVYAQPDLALAPIITIDANLPVQVTGITSNGWFQIALNGTYYVTGDKLVASVSAPASTPAAYTSPAYVYELTYHVNSVDEFLAVKADALSRHVEKLTITTPREIASLVSSHAWHNNEPVVTYGELNASKCSMSYNSRGYFAITYGYTTTMEEELYTEALVTQLVPGFNKGTTYDKIKNVHDYICNTVVYSHDTAYGSADFRSAYDALASGTTVCSGYALLFQKFMDHMQIPCYIAIGPNHAWNLVYLDGAWYHIDVTHDDQSWGISRKKFLRGASYKGATWGNITLSLTDYPYK